MKRSRVENDEDEGNKSMNFPMVKTLPVGDDPSGSTGTSAGPANIIVSQKKHADEGHRYGNFHNYYTFHPVFNRTEHIAEMLNFVAKQWSALQPAPHFMAPFRYTDIGCNEGDLTLEVAMLLSDHITKNFTTPLSNDDNGRVIESHGQSAKVICTGFDLDADLIRRAETKAQKDAGIHPNIQATFKVLNVLHENIVRQSGESNVDIQIPSSVEYSTDLSTLFSTTMWIHFHGGDDGLRRVLQNICSLTRYWILLEPQPSKCYGRAAFRLRRLGLPPIDVSNERLRLRSNIDQAIDGIMKEFHFERVKMSNNSSCNVNDLATLEHTMPNEESVAETRTQWNRPLRLYQRVYGPHTFTP